MEKICIYTDNINLESHLGAVDDYCKVINTTIEAIHRLGLSLKGNEEIVLQPAELRRYASAAWKAYQENRGGFTLEPEESDGRLLTMIEPYIKGLEKRQIGRNACRAEYVTFWNGECRPVDDIRDVLKPRYSVYATNEEKLSLWSRGQQLLQAINRYNDDCSACGIVGVGGLPALQPTMILLGLDGKFEMQPRTVNAIKKSPSRA